MEIDLFDLGYGDKLHIYTLHYIMPLFKKLKVTKDTEILGWCPVESVLPHGEKVPLWPWFTTLLVMVSQ